MASVSKICPTCYLRITELIEYVRYLYRILIRENMQSILLFLFWYSDLVLVKSEFYFQLQLRFVGTSLQNAPSDVIRSQKNCQVRDEEKCSRETELEKKNEGTENHSGTE